MSAGPKSVAPVSRPETARMTLCIRCSMKGRATTMRISSAPEALRPSHVSVEATFVADLRLSCVRPEL